MVIFHFALVQDVAVLRPLVQLAQKHGRSPIALVVSESFKALDEDGLWLSELEALAAEVGVPVQFYADAFDFLQIAGSGRVLVIAGSESSAKAHAVTHELFRSLPGRIITVTLQHGYECVGFLHNRSHDDRVGKLVDFAADLVVSWAPWRDSPAVPPDAGNRLFVAGPTMFIDHVDPDPPRSDAVGLVCENLHSVRFPTGEVRSQFLDTFGDFAARLASVGQSLALRPHPAGRYTRRKNVQLPSNVEVYSEPIYKLDLSRFAYMISAPSTILLDFVKAGVPVAVWTDDSGEIDASHYPGLPRVCNIEDWWRFHLAATSRREELVEAQSAFLDGLHFPGDVRERYLELLSLV